MLQELTIKNFKLFDETGVTIRPGKITVFIGANGTGKSSVLQMLLLLKQSRNLSNLALNGPLINSGLFRDIAHLQDASRRVQVEITAHYQDFTLPGNVSPRLPPSGAVRYVLVFKDGEVINQVVEIGDKGGEQITFSRDSNPSARPFDQIAQITIEGGSSISLRPGRTVAIPIEVGAVGGASAESNEKVQSLLNTVDTLLRNFSSIPAIRGFDRLVYELWAGVPPDDLLAAGGPEKQAALVSNIIASQPELADEVAKRLNTILNGDSRLRSRLAQHQVGSETANGRRSTNLLHEAFGLNQLVAPLLWLSKTPRGAVIGIEEPEIHLHPRAQAALCDVFVDVATQERKQLILTTHSEHILMGLLTAVAQSRLQPDDLAVYEFRREGDAARAERLAVNEYGQVAGGLRGFLEADIDEIGELIEARFQQRRR